MALQLAQEEPEAGPWRVELLSTVVNAVTRRRPDQGSSGRPAVLAIDGRSNNGKTALAARVSELVPGSVVMHTDDIAWEKRRLIGKTATDGEACQENLNLRAAAQEPVRRQGEFAKCFCRTIQPRLSTAGWSDPPRPPPDCRASIANLLVKSGAPRWLLVHGPLRSSPLLIAWVRLRWSDCGLTANYRFDT
jgi:hypothetical protein